MWAPTFSHPGPEPRRSSVWCWEAKRKSHPTSAIQKSHKQISHRILDGVIAATFDICSRISSRAGRQSPLPDRLASPCRKQEQGSLCHLKVFCL